MADYREISQEYAQQGIKGAFLLNGGAAVALLSQAADLKANGLASSVSGGLQIWALGTALAAATWVLAFLSTRYVDKSEREADKKGGHLRISDGLMLAGLITVGLSILFFLLGCIVLASAFA